MGAEPLYAVAKWSLSREAADVGGEADSDGGYYPRPDAEDLGRGGP